MTPQQHIQQFSRMLTYILERHPEEFGLIPDDAGFVSIKELLKALNETDGWRHIRQSHFNELFLVDREAPFEIKDNHIRAQNRDFLPRPEPCPAPPKLLYVGIRKKAYPVVLERGIRPAGHPQVICTADRDTAERLGRRKDNNPVVLTIHTTKTAQRGVRFECLGEIFYLTDYIPPETFTGPPMPKMPEKQQADEPVEAYRKKAGAGTFALTPEHLSPPAPGDRKGKGKKKKLQWKQEQRKNRRR